MSIRDRYDKHAPWVAAALFAALFIAIAFSYGTSKGYHNASQDYYANRSAYEVAEKAYRECAERPTVEEALSCAQKAEKASRDDHRAEQDLNAQRQMADWAEWMIGATVLVGILSVGVTGVGVIYVALTLGEARKTTRAAIRGSTHARAAVVQAKEANDILRLDQRPWLALKDQVVSGMGLRFEDGKAELAVTLPIKNAGKLPAKSTMVDVQMGWVPAESRPMVLMLDAMINRGPPSPTLIMNHMQNRMRRKPGQKHSSYDHTAMIFPSDETKFRRVCSLSADEITKAQALENGVVEILVFVCIDYMTAGDSAAGSRQTSATFQLERINYEIGPSIFTRKIEIGIDMQASELRLVPYRLAAYYAD